MRIDARETILIVEDDSDTREAIRDTLEQEEYQAIDVPDGAAALHYLDSNPAPCAILLDWNMAPMSGSQFMAELKKLPINKQIPVILLTADPRLHDVIPDDGFTARLAKPIDLDLLFKVMRKIVRTKNEAAANLNEGGWS